MTAELALTTADVSDVWHQLSHPSARGVARQVRRRQGPIIGDMGGYSYTPVEFKPLGPPPEAKPDLALATEETMVRIMRDILVQRGALDVEATPQEANGARAQVPAYKFADAEVGHTLGS